MRRNNISVNYLRKIGQTGHVSQANQMKQHLSSFFNHCKISESYVINTPQPEISLKILQKFHSNHQLNFQQLSAKIPSPHRFTHSILRYFNYKLHEHLILFFFFAKNQLVSIHILFLIEIREPHLCYGACVIKSCTKER